MAGSFATGELTDAVLVEIDWQNWIVALGHDPAAADRAVQVRRAMACRPRICTRYLSLDVADAARSDPDSPEARFDTRLAPGGDDVVVTKHDRDVFTNPELEVVLRRLGAKTVVLTGVATEYGVALAAESAVRLGIEVVVVADACAGMTADGHAHALAELDRLGVAVRTIGGGA